jgi:hypothetical protein
VTPLASALLILADYRDPDPLPTLARLEIDGVAGRIVITHDDARVLLITGSNARSDWHAFNFRWWPIPHIDGGDTRKWHRGFLKHAQVVYSWAKGWLSQGGRIDWVCGHSLGAAAAQIAGASLRIPTHAFASPKPLWGSLQPPGHELVTNWCRVDDLVCKVPPWGFSRVGQTVWLTPATRERVWKSHPIEGYVACC